MRNVLTGDTTMRTDMLTGLHTAKDTARDTASDMLHSPLAKDVTSRASSAANDFINDLAADFTKRFGELSDQMGHSVTSSVRHHKMREVRHSAFRGLAKLTLVGGLIAGAVYAAKKQLGMDDGMHQGTPR